VSKQLKTILAVLMASSLMFGFLPLFFPTVPYDFERLHIFLFNLCSGGTMLLFFTEKQNKLSKKARLFLVLSILYAIFVFLNVYVPAIMISIMLAVIVEIVRINKFSTFPLGFFRKTEPVYKKFHQAALLCLSLGLIISCLVIINNKYLHLVSMRKLELNTFFLGFSFPLSLITLSVIFSFIGNSFRTLVSRLKEISFWNINLGVIIFFGFILFEKLLPQIFVTSVLFFTVVIVFFLYLNMGKAVQQKHFLSSGKGFLLVTAITGIAYIFLEFFPGYNPDQYKGLMRLHAFVSLYGWNMSGLAVICRFNDFPIRLHSKAIIGFHWITVLILAPLGNYFRLFAVLAVLGFSLMLYMVFFFEGKEHV